MSAREEILKKYSPTKDNVLFILHELQDNNPQNYLTKEDLEAVADYLDVPYNYIQGVVSFYSMFSTSPRGKYVIRVCESPACYMMGSTDVVKEIAKLLNIGIGETSEDGLFTLELTSCLGVCGVAPAMMINDEVYGNLTPEKVREIIEEKRRGQ